MVRSQEQNKSFSDDTRGRVHGGGVPSVVVAVVVSRSAVTGIDCDGRGAGPTRKTWRSWFD